MRTGPIEGLDAADQTSQRPPKRILQVIKRLLPILLVVVSIAIAVLVTRAVTGSDAHEPTTEERVFLRRIAKDGRVFRIDYSAISDRDLLEAGHEVCRRLGEEPDTPDGITLERIAYEINEEFNFDRAQPEPGAEQDPGVPLRNVDIRLSFAVSDLATEVLCPNLPFNPAR